MSNDAFHACLLPRRAVTNQIAPVSIAEPPPPDVWVHPATAIGPSPIAGRGLFATADLAAGTLVIRLGGRLVSDAELAALIAAPGPYVDTAEVAEDVNVVLPPGSPAHFANHSCDPTLRRDGPYGLVARRAVLAGGELTVDYAALSGPEFRMDCACGAAGCRGVVTGRRRRSRPGGRGSPRSGRPASPPSAPAR
jgi:uncharacterized protein